MDQFINNEYWLDFKRNKNTQSSTPYYVSSIVDDAYIYQKQLDGSIFVLLVLTQKDVELDS